MKRRTILLVLAACVPLSHADDSKPPADWFRPAPLPELGFPQINSDYWQYVRVASHQKVLDDIGASDMQRATMQQLYTDLTNAHRELYAELTPEEKRKRAAELERKRVELWNKTRKLVEKTLTPKQRKRIDQIILQRHRHAVFFYPQLAPELKISEKQKAELRADFKTHQARVKEGMNGRESYRLFWNDVYEVLTEKQRRAFQELRGPAFGSGAGDSAS